MDISAIRFDEKGLVPAVAQDFRTLRVLMVAYMNREALEATVSTGRAHYFSRSRGKLWLKGETSGNFQEVRAIHYDCDADTVLLMVEPRGPACHTGEDTCFYRTLDGAKVSPPKGERVVTELFEVIKGRKGASPEKSYVASLYAKGLDKILKKVEEESGELAEAARVKGKGEIIHELCDLWFHTLVLLSERGIELDEALQELQRRSGTSGIEEKASRGKGK